MTKFKGFVFVIFSKIRFVLNYFRLFVVQSLYKREVKLYHCERWINMADYNFDLEEIRQYVGDLSQIAGAKRYKLQEGRAKGVEAVDIKTGAGLTYTILLDRGLDISWTDYKGKPFSYISNTGVASPEYFEDTGFKSLRNFTGGLITTCGLTYYGRTEEGELGLHGRINNTPAEEIAVNTNLNADRPNITVSGKVREAEFFGEYLVMSREIKSYLGENKIIIKSVIKNKGFEEQPLMFLYHVNYGYPLVQEGTELIAPINNVIPSTSIAEEGLDNHRFAEAPQAGYDEQVFYLDLATDQDGIVTVALINEDLNYGIYEKFAKNQFPRFIQWKQMGKGTYVMGLEPGTNYFEGKPMEKEMGRLQTIKPGENRIFELEIGVLDGKEQINNIKNKIKIK